MTDDVKDLATALKSAVAYEELRDLILNFTLRSGEVVSERSLEILLKTSRTSVRTALTRLQAEGLIRRSGRGYRVTPIEVSVIHDAHDFLSAVEPEALRRATHEKLGERLDALVELIDATESNPEVDRFIAATVAFHLGIAGLTDNDFYVRAVEDGTMRLRRAAWLTAWMGRDERQDWSMHRRIIDHMRADRRSDAAAQMVDLLAYTRARMGALVLDEQRGLHARGLAVA